MQTLTHYGVSEHLIRLYRSLYSYCKSIVRTNLGILEPFTITSGIKQGCTLSPLLFITYIGSISKEVKPKNGIFGLSMNYSLQMTIH